MLPMRPVLIGGPTASGKSALALALAERDHGVVVNADALQVYDAWQVLTARPDAHDAARVPHTLYGHVPLEQPYSVGAWLRDVADVLEAAVVDGRRVVVVGGTGLYLSALVEGLAPIPAIPEEVRRGSSALIQQGAIDLLGDALERNDPETWAAIDRKNPMRVQRAWEVLEATGRGLAWWHRQQPRPLVPATDSVRLVLNPAPAILHRRIAKRLEAMAADGALDECRAVLDRWNPRLPGSKAIGAKDFIAHLQGEISLDEALDRAFAATRRYAKRQRTWFRNRMRGWDWAAPDPHETAALADRVPRV